MFYKRRTRFFVVSLAAALLTLAAFAGPSFAARKVALVIGNAVYAHAPRLANPLNDAGDIGAALSRLGFTVTRLENADQTSLQRGLKLFARAASNAEAAVVFYAGHGIEVGGRNFLVPVDAQLKSDREVEFETVSLDLVSRSVEGAAGLGLVILDACRDNPFAAAMQRAGATRSIGRGLARIEPSSEVLVAYAAKGGTVAADGKGRNSPYSTALLRYLEEPGLEVGLMFRKVRDAVLRETKGKQEPFIYGSLSSEGFWLAGRLAVPRPKSPATAAPPHGGPARSREQLAARAYEAAERLNTIEAFEAVISGFPNSPFAALARGQLRKLRALAADPAAVEAALKLKRRDRALIQLGLAAQGYSPGPADGAIGPATRAALRAWQAKTGRKATGYLTLAGMSALKAAGEAAERKAKTEQERKAEEAKRKGVAHRLKEGCPDITGDFSLEDSHGYKRHLNIGWKLTSDSTTYLFRRHDLLTSHNYPPPYVVNVGKSSTLRYEDQYALDLQIEILFHGKCENKKLLVERKHNYDTPGWLINYPFSVWSIYQVIDENLYVRERTKMHPKDGGKTYEHTLIYRRVK